MLYSYIYLLFIYNKIMGYSFSPSKNIIIPQKGDPYITSKIYFKQTKKKNNEIKHTKIPYITSNFIRASL